MTPTDALWSALVEAATPLTGEALCARTGLGISVAWRAVRELRGEGYRVEGDWRSGLKLEAPTALVLPREVRAQMTGPARGWAVRHRPTTGSTNTDLAALAAADAPEGTTVVAEYQTAGRGRRSRRWTSPRGLGLTFSVLLRPDMPAQDVGLLALLAGIASAEAIQQATGLACRTKWPNDLQAGRPPRKLGGILVEAKPVGGRVQYAIVGIGVNVNGGAEIFPDELQPTATTIAAELEGLGPACRDSVAGWKPAPRVGRAGLLAAILEGLAERYGELQASGPGPLLEAWRAVDLTLGRTVEVHRGKAVYTGTAQDVTARGELVVRTEDGERALDSGEVTIRPQPD